jgi:adenylate cyclase class IV
MATPEEWAERIGKTVNAQITLSWDTKQTLGQYLEIIADNDNEFTIDGFIEYARDNALEVISQLTQIELESYLTLVADDGMEI